MKQLIYILLPFLVRGLLVMVVWFGLGGVVASRGVALVVVVVIVGSAVDC